jgi:hypothetical protein
MLDLETIDDVVNRAASAALKASNLVRANVTPYVDADGESAIKVVLVLRDRWFAKDAGEPVVNTMVRVRRALEEAGEDRQPYFEFISEREWREDGGR